MEATCSSGKTAEQFMVADWVPVPSMDQSIKFNASTALTSFNVGSSNGRIIERLPSLSCFGNESLSEIMSSFGLPENTKTASNLYPQGFPSTNEHNTEKNLNRKKRKLPECGSLQSNSPLNNEAEGQNCNTTETVKSLMEKDETNEKSDMSRGVKENNDDIKEDYVHKRARRGQATNSHSLAERVRREKISERMRLLQDIVPGCNKITGKALMLDEIINYVQSLQRQVEFLSMKLATVNPEVNFNIEQILTKDNLNLHSRYSENSAALAYCSNMVTPHPPLQAGITIPNLQRDLLRNSTNPHISAMAQMASPWDNEYQNFLQMGFVTNLPHDEMELNGSMKVGW